MSESYAPSVSRRTTLQWLAAAMAASTVSPRGLADTQRLAAPRMARGYGTDPDLLHPTAPWPRTMTPHQLSLTAVLADLILPGTESAPAPSTLGIPDFMDEWVSAPYPQQQSDRTIVLDGLQWIDAEARRLWQRDFLQIDAQQREQIVMAMLPKAFWSRFRYIVAGAYYTTPEGFKDIGYIGNVPLTSYPPVTDNERAILDAELRKLGISFVSSSVKTANIL
jgi:hypothetical protein